MRIIPPLIHILDVTRRTPILYVRFDIGYRYVHFFFACYWFAVILKWNAPRWDRDSIETGVELAWNTERHPINEGEHIHWHRWERMRTIYTHAQLNMMESL